MPIFIAGKTIVAVVTELSRYDKSEVRYDFRLETSFITLPLIKQFLMIL